MSDTTILLLFAYPLVGLAILIHETNIDPEMQREFRGDPVAMALLMALMWPWFVYSAVTDRGEHD